MKRLQVFFSKVARNYEFEALNSDPPGPNDICTFIHHHMNILNSITVLGVPTLFICEWIIDYILEMSWNVLS